MRQQQQFQFPDCLARFPRDPADYDSHEAQIRQFLQGSLGLNQGIINTVANGGSAFENHYKEAVNKMLTIYNHEAHTRLVASVDLGNPKGFVVRPAADSYKENAFGGNFKNIAPPTPTSTPSSRTMANQMPNQQMLNRTFASAQSNAGSPINSNRGMNKPTQQQQHARSSPQTAFSAARANGFVNAMQQQRQQQQQSSSTSNQNVTSPSSPTRAGKFTVTNSAMSSQYKQASSVSNRQMTQMPMNNGNNNNGSVYSFMENTIQPSYDMARDSDMSVGQRSTGGMGLLSPLSQELGAPTSNMGGGLFSVSPATPEGNYAINNALQQGNRPSVFGTPPMFTGIQYSNSH